MRALALWLVWLTTGCGTSGPVEFSRACDESAAGDCILYSGADWGPADVSDGCEGEVVESCPPGEIGRCVIDEGGRFETQSFFYPGFWDGQSASAGCRAYPNSQWISK